jgi:hypothetical protein
MKERVVLEYYNGTRGSKKHFEVEGKDWELKNPIYDYEEQGWIAIGPYWQTPAHTPNKQITIMEREGREPDI